MDIEESVEAVAEVLTPNKSKKSDTAYRLVVVILLLCLLCMNLFMKNNYVSRDDYKADQERERVYRERQDDLVSKMHEEVLSLIQSDKINAQQNDEIRDHEQRIRNLEYKAHVIPSSGP